MSIRAKGPRACDDARDLLAPSSTASRGLEVIRLFLSTGVRQSRCDLTLDLDRRLVFVCRGVANKPAWELETGLLACEFVIVVLWLSGLQMRLFSSCVCVCVFRFVFVTVSRWYLFFFFFFFSPALLSFRGLRVDAWMSRGLNQIER